MTVRLPNIASLSAGSVATIVQHLGGEEALMAALGVRRLRVSRWLADGVPAGPEAGCLRYLARENGITLEDARGNCVFCCDAADQQAAYTPVCFACFSDPASAAEMIDFFFETVGNGVDTTHIRAHAKRSFEHPLYAVFSEERVPEEDLKVGDAEFDRHVLIETADYEALFDTFQLLRRRQIVYELTRFGEVVVNVDEVVFRRHPHAPCLPPVPVLTLLLAWSLTFERAEGGAR